MISALAKEDLGMDVDLGSSIAVGRILAPITPERPGGASLVNAPSLARLAAEREEELAILAGTWPGPPRPPRWSALARRCEGILAGESKDLKVAAWLVEAGLRSEGFAGLAAGLDAMAGLHEGLWDALHPRPGDPGEDAFEERAKWLRWLDHRAFVQGVGAAPLTPPEGEAPPVDLNAYRAARGAGGSCAELDRLADQAPPERWARLGGELDACLSALDRLEAIAGQRYGEAGEIVLPRLRGALGECLEIVDRRRPRVEAPPPRAGGGGSEGSERPPASATAPAEGARLGEGGRPLPARSAGPLATLEALQGALDRADSGRERFLRRLEVAEFCVDEGLVALARPLLHDLQEEARAHAIHRWEGATLPARLYAAQLAVAARGEIPAALPPEPELFEALCRLDVARAYQFIHGGPGASTAPGRCS